MAQKWEKFTDEELANFVAESKSFREVTTKIGYAPNGGSSVANVKKMIDKKQFDTSHFTGQGWNKDNFDYERFRYGNAIVPANALNALIALRGRKCENCGLEEWQRKEIPLEVHHIDGDHLNSTLDNLQILCCNCHAQTENFRRKNHRVAEQISDEALIQAIKEKPNIRQALLSVGLTGSGGNYKRAYELAFQNNLLKIEQEEDKIKILLPKKEKKEYKCKDCGKSISKSGERCIECAHKIQQKCDRPSREELKEQIYSKSFLQIGKDYKVSDNTIRKWCKFYKLPSKKEEIKKYSKEEWINI